MPGKIAANPSAQVFAEAWAKEVLQPAAEALAGSDGRVSVDEAKNTASLTATNALAADDFQAVFARTGVRTSTAVSTLVKQGVAYAKAAAEKVAGSDGVISAEEAKALGALQKDFSELTQPAQALRFSASVARGVLAEFGLTDLDALLAASAQFDNGNGYLSRAELELGAKTLQGNLGREIGVVSDLDDTVIPPERASGQPAPYPGVAALYRELELAHGGKPGDVRYVTARSPDRVVDVPKYLEDNGVPAGPIDTGISQLPWVAQPEKVRDITRIFEANPDQKFVLFGDTSARDPEVYREIQAKFPDQVAAVFIHKVNKTVDPKRVEGQTMVDNYALAAAALLKAKIIDEASAKTVMLAAQAEGLAITTAEIDALLAANR